jgi:UDP-glucose 4-epimerase
MNNLFLVTGSSGFLGSHVSDILTDKGHKVILFDKKTSKYKKKNQKMILGDINDLKKLNKATKNIHTIFHFAAKADLNDANKKPFHAIEDNINGTVKIFKAALKNKVKKIIFASSIYARSEQGGIYSTTKLASEMILERLCKKFKIKFVILRFGTVYGERSNKFNTVNNFINDASRKKRIYRETKGNEIRSYIHVKDVAKIVYKSLKKKYENSYINVLGSKKTTVKKLLNIIKGKVPELKISYSKNDKRMHNYKINPFTYKIRVGKIIKLERYIKLQDGIHKLINL